MNQNPCTNLAAALALATALAPITALADGKTDPVAKIAMSQHARYKAVFHVADGDPKKWGQALNNAQNVQEALGKDNGRIEIVANGGGIGMLKFDSEMGNRIRDLQRAGINIVACENTMKRLNLTRDDMLPDIGYVPSGVIEVMQKQQEGWSYVRN